MQIDWVLDYLDDIESDLSAVHGVADWRTLPGPRYFMLAARLAAYPGVMQARAIALEQAKDGGASSSSSSGERATVVSDGLLLAQLANDGWAEHEGREG